MKKIKLSHLLYALCICFLSLLSANVQAQISDATNDGDYGSFYTVTQGGSSSVSIITPPAGIVPRSGSNIFKHTAAGSSKRAEIDGGFDTSHPTGGYWYGWSMYFPSSDWNSAITQYIGQWRFSNLLESGYSKQNCTTRACGVGGNAESGSGHHLKVVDGNSFEFTIRSFDPDCADCEGTITTKKTFGGFVKDQWMDFVMQANWSYETDGFIKIWKQNGNGGYELVMEYYGRTWVRKFADGSRFAGRDVYKPNWTVGLYFSSDNDSRTMYSDNIRESTTDTGGLCADGFLEIKPDSNPCGAAIPTAPLAPAGLIATGADSQVGLSWSATSGATSYDVLRSTTSGSGYTSVATGITSTSYTNTGLTNGTPYYYVVTATNSVGTSGNSVQVSATPISTLDCGTAVAWSNSAFTSQTASFSVEFDAVPGGANMDGVVGLSNGAASAYSNLACAFQFAADGTIKARNAGAYVAANVVSYTVGTSYHVKMDVNRTNKTYSIYVTPAGGSQQTIGTGYAFRTEQNTVTQLNNRAINTLGCSLAVTNFTSRTVVSAPTGFNALAGNAQVSLSWTASTGATSYNVKRSTTSGSGYTLIATITGVTSTSYVNTGLTNGTTYYYVVTAANSGGESVNSSQAFTTPNDGVFSPIPYFGNKANYTPLTASRWGVNSDGGELRYYITTSNFNQLSGDRLGEYSLINNRVYNDFNITLKARVNENLATNGFADYALVFGFVNSNNYLYMLFNSGLGQTQLFKVINGVRNLVATSATGSLTDNLYHNVGLKRTGSEVRVYFDGVEIIVAQDSGLATAGPVGVGSFNDAAYFDDILVNRNPAASFVASPSTGFVPLTVNFDASLSSDPDNDQLSYSWNFGDGNTGEGSIVSHEYITADTFTVSLTVLDGKGGSSTTSQTVLAKMRPSVNITAPTAGAVYGVCNEFTISASLANFEGNVTEVSFYSNGVSIGSDTDGSNGWSVVYGGVVGTHTITASASDDTGYLANSEPVDITIVDPLLLTSASVNVSCFAGSNGSIDLTVEGGILPYTYSWSNGSSSEDLSDVSAGVYSVVVTDASGCTIGGTYTITQPTALEGSISVNPVYTVTPGGQAYTIYLGYGPQSVNLNTSTSGGVAGYTFNWSPTSGVVSPNAASTSVSPTSTTTYSVTITDANGCTLTNSQTINVIDVRCGNKNDKVLVCQVPSGNPSNSHTICISPSAVATHLSKGDYLGNCTNTTSAASEIDMQTEVMGETISKLNVYPNPTEGSFVVELPASGKNTYVTLSDLKGKIVESKSIKDNKDQKLKFDLNGLTKGIYIIEVVSNNTIRRLKVVMK